MDKWPDLVRTVAIRALDSEAARPARLGSIADALQWAAEAVGERITGTTAGRQATGLRMPSRAAWEALCKAAGMEGGAAWQAERDARRARQSHAARRRPLTEEEIRGTWALPAKEAARSLDCSRQAVEAARRRWPCAR